ncbi:class I SAM-dependent methyltransferase, partial [Streptomyces sp. NPDC059468]
PRERVTALLDPRPISIVCAVPRREVYEGCLRAAGFSDVKWVPLQVSEAGIHEYGEVFWADLLAHPPLEMLRCRA